MVRKDWCIEFEDHTDAADVVDANLFSPLPLNQIGQSLCCRGMLEDFRL